MSESLLVGVWVVLGLISVGCAALAGYAWGEGQRAGGWGKFATEALVDVAAVGFTWTYATALLQVGFWVGVLPAGSLRILERLWFVGLAGGALGICVGVILAIWAAGARSQRTHPAGTRHREGAGHRDDGGFIPYLPIGIPSSGGGTAPTPSFGGGASGGAGADASWSGDSNGNSLPAILPFAMPNIDLSGTGGDDDNALGVVALLFIAVAAFVAVCAGVVTSRSIVRAVASTQAG